MIRTRASCSLDGTVCKSSTAPRDKQKREIRKPSSAWFQLQKTKSAAPVVKMYCLYRSYLGSFRKSSSRISASHGFQSTCIRRMGTGGVIGFSATSRQSSRSWLIEAGAVRASHVCRGRPYVAGEMIHEIPVTSQPGTDPWTSLLAVACLVGPLARKWD